MQPNCLASLNLAVLRMAAEASFGEEAGRIARELLECETAPTDLQGYTAAPFSGHSRYFGLNEFRYVENGEALGTFGLGPCLGLLLVGEGVAAGAHIEVVSEYIHFLSDALRHVKPLRAYLIGGYSDSGLAYDVRQILGDVGVPVQVAINLGGGDRGAGFIFNTQTNSLHLMPRREHFLVGDIAKSIECQTPYDPSEKRELTCAYTA